MKTVRIIDVLLIVLGLAAVVLLFLVFSKHNTIQTQLADILSRQHEIQQRILSVEDQQKNLATLVIQRQNRPSIANRTQRPSENPNKIYDLPIAHSPVKGNKNAAVTIIEFSDYQCPYCRKFHPELNKVLAAYPNDVKYILKHFPLNIHHQAKSAAKAALAAIEQDKYWEMSELLLANGRHLNEHIFPQLAVQLGMNVDQFLKNYNENGQRWEEMIRKDMALGARAGVRGTPSFFINGKKTRARDYSSFKQEIDAILKSKNLRPQ